MCNRVAAQARIAAYAQSDVCCQKRAVGFVDSLFEIVTPLVWGRPVVVVSEAAASDAEALAGVVEREHVTRLVTVPSLAAALIEVPDAGRRLGRIAGWTLSGEALPAELLERLSSVLPACRFVNLYGSDGGCGGCDLSCCGWQRDAERSDRSSDRQHAGLCAGRPSGAGADRRAGRALHWRQRVWRAAMWAVAD